LAVINVDSATKRYGDVVALSDVSVEIEPGVTGLLGPNGAGKTTLLKMMTGLLAPTSGSVALWDASPRSDPSLYGRIGYCPEGETLYGFMTGRTFLAMNARLHGLADPNGAAQRALQQVDLVDEADKRIRAYSRGMRQRIKMAQALLHDPDVLLLDEPLKGADPTQRRTLMDLIVQLGQAGHTVVVSSHVLHEVERMAAEIVLIHRGRLLASGDYHAIREAMDGRPHKVSLEAEEPRRLAAVLTEGDLVNGVELQEDRVVVDIADPSSFYRDLPRVALDAEIRLTEITSLDEDLESVFRYLVQ